MDLSRMSQKVTRSSSRLLNSPAPSYAETDSDEDGSSNFGDQWRRSKRHGYRGRGPKKNTVKRPCPTPPILRQITRPSPRRFHFEAEQHQTENFSGDQSQPLNFTQNPPPNLPQNRPGNLPQDPPSNLPPNSPQNQPPNLPSESHANNGETSNADRVTVTSPEPEVLGTYWPIFESIRHLGSQIEKQPQLYQDGIPHLRKFLEVIGNHHNNVWLPPEAVPSTVRNATATATAPSATAPLNQGG